MPIVLPRHPPPSPRRKVSSEKGLTKSTESTAKTPSSSAVTSPRTSSDSIQVSSDQIFLYEDVDKMEENGRSRESSVEKDTEVSSENTSFLKLSESVPSFSTHLAVDKVDKAPGKKKGFRKFLMRNSSKKKNSLPTLHPSMCCISKIAINYVCMRM